MPFPTDTYDAETFALMKQAFDDAWGEIECMTGSRLGDDATVVRTMISLRIIMAVREGERDPDKLRVLALEAAKPTHPR